MKLSVATPSRKSKFGTTIVAGRPSRSGQRPRNNIFLFDIDGRWNEIMPFLDEPLVQRALNAGMTSYLADAGGRREWKPGEGPWVYSRTDYWATRSQDLANESPEWTAFVKAHPWVECDDPEEQPDSSWSVFDRISEQFYPQPSTPNWFRCYGACHWLAGWNCAIGQLLMPERDWYVLSATRHSNAIGLGPDDIAIMDILWGHDHTPAQIWRAVGRGTCATLADEIAVRMRRDATTTLACRCATCFLTTTAKARFVGGMPTHGRTARAPPAFVGRWCESDRLQHSSLLAHPSHKFDTSAKAS